MKRVWNFILMHLMAFLISVAYFTRIPIADKIGYPRASLIRARSYFPLVGLLVGLISALAFYVSSLIFSSNLSVLFAMLTSILMTGALHEDGLADTFDAVVGGTDEAHVLTIMQDSRLGTYGTIAIISALGAKYLCLLNLVALSSNEMSFLIFLIAAHALSRFIVLTCFYTHHPSQSINTQSKFHLIMTTKTSINEFLLAGIFALIPFLFLDKPYFLLSIVPVYLAKYSLTRYFNKKLNGFTGDCLGAIQQVTEIIFYISCIFIFKMIHP